MEAIIAGSQNYRVGIMKEVTTILLVIFIVLKLTGNIDWSWWWVLSPFWIPTLLAILLLIIMLIIKELSED